MKILMLGWELPPHNSGGLGVACYYLAKQLANDGADVDFVVPYKAKHNIKEFTVYHASEATPANIFDTGGAYGAGRVLGKDAEVPAHASGIRGLQRQYVRYIEESIESLAPDIIHAHDWLTYEAGMRAKQLTGKPLIAHVHATEFDRAGSSGGGNPIVHDIEYNGLMMADRIITVSQLTKDLIVDKYNIPADKIDVLYNGLNAEDLLKLDADMQSYAYIKAMKKLGYTVVVSLGRLTVQKGLTHLLQAAAKALAVNDKLLFLLAGNGEQRDELLELSAELGIADKVLFSGFVRGAQWRAAYEIGDIFIMSSVSEPFGLTALEAAQCDNALILTKQSGVGEIVNNAFRYDYWDIDKLADQIVAIADHPSLRQSLADNVKHELERFSWNIVAERCSGIYDRLSAEGAAI